MRFAESIRRVMSEERGVALVMVLVLAAVALAVTSALLYTLTIGTRISGSQKRFETAQAAAFAGKEVAMKWIGGREMPDIGIAVLNSVTDDCMAKKFLSPTADWGADCDASLSIDTSNSNTYDITFELGDYSIYAKIVNTVDGNSGPSGSGLAKRGTTLQGSAITTSYAPYLYTIEVEASRTTISSKLGERARYSILYQY